MNNPKITAAPRREGGPVAVQAAMDRIRGARRAEIRAEGGTPAVQTPVEPGKAAWGLGLDNLTKTKRRVLGTVAAGGATLLVTSGCNPFASENAGNETPDQNPTTGTMTVLIDGKPVEVTVTNANNNEFLGDAGDTYIVDGQVVKIGATSADTGTTDDAPESESTEASMQYRDFHLAHGASFKVVDGYLVIEAGGIEGQTEGVRISLEGRGLVLKSDARIDGNAYPVDPASGTPMYDVYGSAGYKDHTGSVAFLLPDADCGAEEALYVHTEWGGNLELVPLDEAANTGKTYFDELKEAVKDQSTGAYTDGGLVYDMGQGGAFVTKVAPGANINAVTESIVGTELDGTATSTNILRRVLTMTK